MTTGSRVSITCSRRSVQKTQINYDKLTSGGLQKDCRRWRRSVKTVQKWFKNWFQVDYSTTPSPDFGDILISVFFSLLCQTQCSLQQTWRGRAFYARFTRVDIVQTGHVAWGDFLVDFVRHFARLWRETQMLEILSMFQIHSKSQIRSCWRWQTQFRNYDHVQSDNWRILTKSDKRSIYVVFDWISSKDGNWAAIRRFTLDSYFVAFLYCLTFNWRVYEMPTRHM